MNTESTTPRGVTLVKIDTSFGSDAGGDFTLPDYMPEIRRLLYVSSSVLPEGKFLNGGVLELDGTLTYNAVYVGDDGSVTSAPLVTEYGADTALGAETSGTDGIFVDTQIESTTCRATGPRSLNIKSRLKFHVTSDGELESAPVSDGGIEKLTEDVKCAVRYRGSVTESVAGEFSAKSGSKPVICDGFITVRGASPTDGGVRAEGVVTVRCLMKDGEGYALSSCEIPFDATVPIESDTPLDGARAWGRIASLNVAQNEDGTYTVSVEYDLDAEAYGEENAEICSDAYSREREYECEYRDVEIPEMIAFGTKRAELSGETELRGEADGARVLDTAPAIIQAAIALSDGKVTLSGSVKLRALISAGSEIYAKEVEMPFRFDIADAPEGVATPDLQTSLVGTECASSAKITGDALTAKCDVAFTYSVARRRRATVVTAVRTGDELPAADPCIKVYYPERDESEWSVAKRYLADRARLERNNSFPSGVAEKGKPVIII